MKKKTENSLSLCQRLYEAITDEPEPLFVASESKRERMRELLLEGLTECDDVVTFDTDVEAKKWARFQQYYKPARTIHQTLIEALTQ